MRNKCRGKKVPFPYIEIINNDRGGVTPSNLYIVVNYNEYGKTRKEIVGIDCGLAQGKDAEKSGLGHKAEMLQDGCKNYFTTHGHVDHVGGYVDLCESRRKKGIDEDIEVYMTHGTMHYMPAIQNDNLKVRTAENSGKPPYSERSIREFLDCCIPLGYNEPINVNDYIKCRLVENAHTLDASMVFLEVLDNNANPLINVLVTGDYKKENNLAKDAYFPDWIRHKPLYLIIESTYATESKASEVKKFRKDILSFINKNKGNKYFNVLVPAFSMETTEHILYELALMQAEGLIPRDIKIRLDGQLSESHLKKVLGNPKDYRLKEGIKILPDNLEIVGGGERRLVINNKSEKQIVVASGGMMQGASQNYLVPWLKNKNTLIYAIGYKPEGTAGYRVANAKPGDIISLGDTELSVQAQIEWTREFSRHSKQEELIEFILSFDDIRGLFIVHGEEEAREEFVKLINNDSRFSNVKFATNLNYKQRVIASQYKVEDIKENK